MNYNSEKRCTSCKEKTEGCSTWDNKEEITLSGWDKNRFAICCREYNKKDRPAPTEAIK